MSDTWGLGVSWATFPSVATGEGDAAGVCRATGAAEVGLALVPRHLEAKATDGDAQSMKVLARVVAALLADPAAGLTWRMGPRPRRSAGVWWVDVFGFPVWGVRGRVRRRDATTEPVVLDRGSDTQIDTPPSTANPTAVIDARHPGSPEHGVTDQSGLPT